MTQKITICKTPLKKNPITVRMCSFNYSVGLLWELDEQLKTKCHKWKQEQG